MYVLWQKNLFFEHVHLLPDMLLTLVLQRGGGCNNPPTRSQGVKLLHRPLSSSFPLILAKKIWIYHLHRGKLSKLGGQGGWYNPMILKFGYFENIWSDMYSKFCLQVTIIIF